jgi:hypothetical protein
VHTTQVKIKLKIPHCGREEIVVAVAHYHNEHAKKKTYSQPFFSSLAKAVKDHKCLHARSLSTHLRCVDWCLH